KDEVGYPVADGDGAADGDDDGALGVVDGDEAADVGQLSSIKRLDLVGGGEGMGWAYWNVATVVALFAVTRGQNVPGHVTAWPMAFWLLQDAATAYWAYSRKSLIRDVVTASST